MVDESDKNTAPIDEPTQAVEHEGHHADSTAISKKTPFIVYILYLSSLVFGVTGLIGLIMAYVSTGRAPDWEKTHYQFQIRTFWLGFFYITIVIALFFTIIFMPLAMLLGLMSGVWYIVRCVKGMMAYDAGEPIENPKTWWF